MMDRKYLLNSSIQVARLSRLIAKSIDLGIVALLSFFIYPLGVILGLIYLSIADYLQVGQSVGKRIIGLAVISLENGGPCTLKQSFIRNLPLSLPWAFCIVPFWGWIIAAIMGIPIAAFEIYLIYKLDSGHRLGDVMADTSVMANDGPQAVVKKRRRSWFNEENASETPL